jgi:hypothetical protein
MCQTELLLHLLVFEYSHAEVTGTYKVTDKFSVIYFLLVKCTEIHTFKCAVIRVTKES